MPRRPQAKKPDVSAGDVSKVLAQRVQYTIAGHSLRELLERGLLERIEKDLAHFSPHVLLFDLGAGQIIATDVGGMGYGHRAVRIETDADSALIQRLVEIIRESGVQK